MARSPIETQKLLQDLQKDVASVEEKVKTGAAARGSKLDVDADAVSARAIRTQRGVFSEKEFSDLDNELGNILKSLSYEAGIQNTFEQEKFEKGLRERFNKFKIYMLQRTAHLNKEAARLKLDQAKRQSLMAALSGLGQELTAQFVGSLGGITEGTDSKLNVSGETINPYGPRGIIGSPE